MKKIGTITFHKASNYGAYLQCYALQNTLTANGYDSSVIDYETPADIERYKLINTSNPKNLLKSFLLFPLNKKRNQRFSVALKKISLSDPKSEFDVAIAGSDQIWNANLSAGKLDRFFTLEAVNAQKKISYAASIGDESSVKKYPKAFRQLTARLDSISVRENQAKDVLKSVTDKKITTVVDPTLLLTANQWSDTISTISRDNREYIFSYFIGITPLQCKVLAAISEKLKMKVMSYSQIPKEKHILKHCYTDGPFDFLARLRDAKIVITSSFHGTALSIIMHKNFYVLLPAKKKRSRMDNILKLVGLTDRIIETEADIEKINLDNIDYTKPQKKLDKLRQESLDWFKNAIDN